MELKVAQCSVDKLFHLLLPFVVPAPGSERSGVGIEPLLLFSSERGTGIFGSLQREGSRFKVGIICNVSRTTQLLSNSQSMSSFFSSLIRPPASIPQPGIAAAAPTSQQSSNNPIATASTVSNNDDPIMLWQSLKNDGYCILPGEV
jgi:hypothetical protein